VGGGDGGGGLGGGGLGGGGGSGGGGDGGGGLGGGGLGGGGGGGGGSGGGGDGGGGSGGGSGGGLGGGGRGGGEHALGVRSVKAPALPPAHCAFTTRLVLAAHASATVYGHEPLPTNARTAGSASYVATPVCAVLTPPPLQGAVPHAVPQPSQAVHVSP
jgi:hypothetical protein